MTSAAAAKIRQLNWEYPEEEGKPFLLWDEGVKAGWMEFHEGPSEFTTGEFKGQKWIFRYSAHLHPRVTVYAENSPEALAEYVPGFTGGGVVSFSSGVRYRWRRADIWGSRWCFRQANESAALCISQEAGPLTEGGTVALCSGAAELAETPVLLLLAWFLRIMDFELLVEGIFRVG